MIHLTPRSRCVFFIIYLRTSVIIFSEKQKEKQNDRLRVFLSLGKEKRTTLAPARKTVPPSCSQLFSCLLLFPFHRTRCNHSIRLSLRSCFAILRSTDFFVILLSSLLPSLFSLPPRPSVFPLDHFFRSRVSFRGSCRGQAVDSWGKTEIIAGYSSFFDNDSDTLRFFGLCL